MSLGSFQRFGQIQINLWRIYKRLKPLKAAKFGARQKFIRSVNKEGLVRIRIEQFESRAFGEIQNNSINYIKRIEAILCKLHIEGVSMMQDDKICANKFPTPPTPPVGNPFIYEVTVTGGDRTYVPIVDNTGTNNFTVDWGDGSPIETFNMVIIPDIIEHVYSSTGIFTVTITGQVDSIAFSLIGRAKRTDYMSNFIQFGSLTGLTYLDFSSSFGSNPTFSATDIPPSSITNMDYLFGYRSLNVDISNWNLTNLTSITDAFYNNPNVSQANYSAALVKMDSIGLLNQSWDGTQQTYDMAPSAAATARANLITKGWTINDLGPA